MVLHYVDWLLAGSLDLQEVGCGVMDWFELAQDRDRCRAQDRSCQQPVNITHDNTNCCSYRVDPPDDEQQACSKRRGLLLK